MVFGMTAFGKAQCHHELGFVCWEVRSVNHRFLDIHMKVPDMFREQEMSWRQIIKENITRGKIECYLNFNPEKLAPSMQLNGQVVEQLQKCSEQLKAFGISSALSPIDILKWPDAISKTPMDIQEISPILEQTLKDSLSIFQQNRHREGLAIKEILLQKLDKMEDLHKSACELAPQRLGVVQDKLKNKIIELSEDLLKSDMGHPSRLEQELILMAQRLDVDEELDRLKMHIAEARRHINSEVVSGKRLDFLMQEFNREANTLASKANMAALTQTALELKVVIEQMREQIQNVE